MCRFLYTLMYILEGEKGEGGEREWERERRESSIL